MTKAQKKTSDSKSKKLNKTVSATNVKTDKKPASEPQPVISKQATIINLMQRPTGATIEEASKATGWQKHSVRGVISGVLKKRLNLTISSLQEERGRVYRIAGNC